MFGTKQDCIHRCLKCGEENVKSTIQMVCNLIFSKHQNGTTTMNGSGESKSSGILSFKRVLESTLCFSKTTPAWCEACKKFTPTNQHSKV